MTSDYYFSQGWIDPDDPHCNADEYFKQISYIIDLNELYRVLDTCYYNDEMPYCPIFLQLTQPRLIQSNNNCEYMIQVWNLTQKKIFEQPLKNKIRGWWINTRYLLYRLETQSDDEKYVYIVDLEQNNYVVKVKSFGLDENVKYLQYNNGFLCACTDNEIQIFQFTANFTKEGTVADPSSSGKFRKIQTSLKIIALTQSSFSFRDKYLIVVFETLDNQLEFNKLILTKYESDLDFSYYFEQLKENSPRKLDREDPIIKYQTKFSKGFQYGMTLRKSGEVDLYWNYTRKDTVKNQSIVDITMSIGSFYFKTMNGIIYGFEHMNDAGITFQKAEIKSPSQIQFNQVYMKIVQNIVRLYSGFHIVRILGITQALIAHGKFVSIFDIINWKWLNHIEFEDEIIYLTRHYETKDARANSILCKNGAFYYRVLDFDKNTAAVDVSKRRVKFEGQILKYSEDIENQQTLYVLKKENNLVKLQVLIRCKIQDITDIPNITEKLNIVQFQSRGVNTTVLFQNGENVYLFLQKIVDNKVQLEKLKEFSTKSFVGQLHSGCAIDINKNLFLFDNKNMYLVTLVGFEEKTPKITTFDNIYCSGIQTITNSFNYALCQETADAQNPGLRFFDMESIINKNKCQMTLLKKIDVGCNGYFEQGTTVNRLGFLNSLTNLFIVPLLHRHMNKFMGFGNTSEYLFYNVIKDKFFAFTQSSHEILTWNLFNGKFEQKQKITNLDFTKLQVQTHGEKSWNNGRVLFKTKEVVKDVEQSEYFFPWQLQPNIDKGKTFQQALAISFRKYYYIEITSASELRIQLEFIHPHYEFQRMFINDTKDRMVTVLINYRVFLYEAENIDPTNESKIRWRPYRQIIDYANNLDNQLRFLEFFSPCLTRYMTLDKKERQIVIRDLFTGHELFRVPSEILQVSKNDNKAKQTTNRIKWIDYHTLKVVSKEGIENIYDIDNGFKIIAFNNIPLFNQIEGQKEWQNNHFYKERQTIVIDNRISRLKRFYQNYKSAYYLKNNTQNVNYLISAMFQVDWQYFDHNEQPFSFLHWSLLEQLQKGVLKLDDLEFSVIQELVYSILPGGNTILNLLCNQKEQLIKLFQLTHSNEGIICHVPFLPNFYGKTAFHLLKKNQDYKSIDEILKYLSKYNIDHHSRSIKHLYPTLIEQQLPNFFKYLDSRFQQTIQINHIDKGCLKDDADQVFTSKLWFQSKDIENKVLVQNQKVATSIKLEFLDLPGMFNFLDEDFDDFFRELANTDKFEYFSNKAVQKIIEFIYPIVLTYISYIIVIPFLIFHVTFVVYMNVIYEHRRDNDQYYYANWVFAIALFVFSFYFLGIELKQLLSIKLQYIKSIWNYIDLFAPFGVSILLILQFLDLYEYEINQDFNRSILAISTFFMWFKLLYIMRMFKATGYLIRMIIEVIFDMGVFLLLLFITILAFGDSFLRLSLGNEDGQQFIESSHFAYAGLFAYQMVIGSFDTTQFGDVALPLTHIQE